MHENARFPHAHFLWHQVSLNDVVTKYQPWLSKHCQNQPYSSTIEETYRKMLWTCTDSRPFRENRLPPCLATLALAFCTQVCHRWVDTPERNDSNKMQLLLMKQILHQLRLVVYPILYRGFISQGFLPSTVSPKNKRVTSSFTR